MLKSQEPDCSDDRKPDIRSGSEPRALPRCRSKRESALLCSRVSSNPSGVRPSARERCFASCCTCACRPTAHTFDSAATRRSPAALTAPSQRLQPEDVMPFSKRPCRAQSYPLSVLSLLFAFCIGSNFAAAKDRSADMLDHALAPAPQAPWPRCDPLLPGACLGGAVPAAHRRRTRSGKRRLPRKGYGNPYEPDPLYDVLTGFSEEPIPEPPGPSRTRTKRTDEAGEAGPGPPWTDVA